MSIIHKLRKKIRSWCEKRKTNYAKCKMSFSGDKHYKALEMCINLHSSSSPGHHHFSKLKSWNHYHSSTKTLKLINPMKVLLFDSQRLRMDRALNNSDHSHQAESALLIVSSKNMTVKSSWPSRPTKLRNEKKTYVILYQASNLTKRNIGFLYCLFIWTCSMLYFLI